MVEIIKISLENEMDLVLAHKRTMKLSELCGLSVSSQTIFATAVSEISRCAITHGRKAAITLSIDGDNIKKKNISVSVYSKDNLLTLSPDGIAYAKKLMGDLQVFQKDGLYETRIKHVISYGGLINNARIEQFKHYFKNEPPVSPYDEIRKKNIQLIDLSEKLRKSETRYRMLTDNLPLMMFALNNKVELDYFNKGLKDYLALKDTDTQLLWQQIVHPEDFTAIWQDWEKALANRSTFRAQGRIKEKETGKYFWHLISIVPVKSEKDVSVNWIGFFVDIHAQKQIEATLKDNQELKKAQAELREYQQKLEVKIHELNISNRDLEQFAYVASHDLQEPLRKIKTFSLLLENELTLADKQKRYFGRILSSVDRMSELIVDVLDYSRLSRSNVDFEDIDMNTLISDIESDYELTIKEKNATIKYGKLPVITGMPSQIKQLFFNLMGNSLKFSTAEPVIQIKCRKLSSVEAAKHNLTPLRSYQLIEFSDNGIGFEQRFAEQIFTIFQRLNSQVAFPGTGIGLALCKKIVDNHKGIIYANSEVGKGTAFSIVLPL